MIKRWSSNYNIEREEKPKERPANDQNQRGENESVSLLTVVGA